ncbi:MAG: beta-galactosidase trimerization domain-containing protein [Clostridia bacterium]|nr:beta-galactosidase trimerization domain-containing protein [Clostridia bacterium]
MSNKYKTTYRSYLIDHHSPDPPIVTFDNLNAEEYEEFFKNANIDSLILYCKDHWGAAYYNTKIGKKHPGLKQDWIAELKEVLTKNDIEFTAYYCIEYDNHAGISHPDWRIIDKDGQPLRRIDEFAKWWLCCYETGYREYCIQQLKEIVSNYQPDSLFLDILGASLCYCPSCLAKFKDIYGYDLPRDERSIMDKKGDILEFLDLKTKEFLKLIKSTLKEIDPSLAITINFSSHYTKDVRDMLDYQFSEPWAGNWLSAAYARDTAVGRYPQLGPGEESRIYDYKPENIYILDIAEITAQGCKACIYSGSQHIDGTLEHEEAKRMGAAYKEVKRYQKYLGQRSPVKEIAILQSDKAANIKLDKIIPDAILKAKQGNEHRRALLGAMKLCDYSKIPWNILPEQDACYQELMNYKMLILPNVYYINDELKQNIKRFVENGGFVIACGETGLYDKNGDVLDDFSLSDIYACSYIGTCDKYVDNGWGAYLKLNDDDVWKYMPDTTPPVSKLWHQIKTEGAKTIANYILPSTEVTMDKWVNWWSPPPGELTEYPAVTINNIGKGIVLYTAFDFLSMENERFNWIKKFFKGITEQYIQKPKLSLSTENMNILKMSYFDRKDRQELIIHQVSNMCRMTGGHDIAVDGGTLVVNSNFREIKSAHIVYPDNVQLKVEKLDDVYKIKLPDIGIHQVIKIDYME